MFKDCYFFINLLSSFLQPLHPYTPRPSNSYLFERKQGTGNTDVLSSFQKSNMIPILAIICPPYRCTLRTGQPIVLRGSDGLQDGNPDKVPTS